MSTKEKRLERLLNHAKDFGWTIDDLEQVMLDYGIERLPGSSTGHRNYGYALNSGIHTLTVPTHGRKVKPYYVKQARKVIKEIIANGG